MEIKYFPDGMPEGNDWILYQSATDSSYKKTLASNLLTKDYLLGTATSNDWILYQSATDSSYKKTLASNLLNLKVSNTIPSNPTAGMIWREIDALGFPVEDWYFYNNKWYSRRKTFTLPCHTKLSSDNKVNWGALCLDTGFYYLFRRAVARMAITSVPSSASSIFFSLYFSPSTSFISLLSKVFNPVDWSSQNGKPGGTILYYQNELNLFHDPFTLHGIEGSTTITSTAIPSEYLSSFYLDYHLVRR